MWWIEICIVGYGDKKDVFGWFILNLIELLIYMLIMIVWVVFCYYVVVNFG